MTRRCWEDRSVGTTQLVLNLLRLSSLHQGWDKILVQDERVLTAMSWSQKLECRISSILLNSFDAAASKETFYFHMISLNFWRRGCSPLTARAVQMIFLSITLLANLSKLVLYVFWAGCCFKTTKLSVSSCASSTPIQKVWEKLWHAKHRRS